MAQPTRFDAATQMVALSRDLDASPAPIRHHEPSDFRGVNVGVAAMSENSPHNGECHNDGDEILYLISGRARVVFTDDDDVDDIELETGDGLIVPKGKWHRVDILEPCRIVYMTPSANNDIRPLEATTPD